MLLMTALLFMRQIIVAFSRFRIKTKKTNYVSIDDAPTVSVCIPARNETHAMTRCLESVLSSSYPKLEIIVLDDSSVDNTSILIKSFAHSGVRFVEGSQLPDGWLGKNHALEGLAREASGELIVYMDVDTQIKSNTISLLVSYIKNEDAQMVSVLPRRTDGLRGSVLFATLRYFWSIITHSRSRPLAASALWVIKRDYLLKNAGGFASMQRVIQPESVLAKALAADDKYRILIGSDQLDVAYEKKWSSQVETSIRLLFPLSGGTWHRGLAATLFLTFLNLPLVALVVGLMTSSSVLIAAGVVFTIIFSGLFAVFTYQLRTRNWWFCALLWPVVIFQELVIFIISWQRYARGRVTWKGRRISNDMQELSAGLAIQTGTTSQS